MISQTSPHLAPPRPISSHLSIDLPRSRLQVEQSATVTPMAAQPAELLALLQSQLMQGEYKVVVFFVTASRTQHSPSPPPLIHQP